MRNDFIYHLPAVPQNYTLVKGSKAPWPIPEDQIFWSGTDVPAVGEEVNVLTNDFGKGRVTGYFVEHGFLGIHVFVFNRPDYHKKQQPDRDICCFFGVDLDPPYGPW